MYGRQEFGLVKRKMRDGKIVYYYWIYDENSKRIYRSTGKRTKAEATRYVLQRRDDNLLGEKDRENISMKAFCKDLFVWDRCPIIKNKLDRGKHFTQATAINKRYRIENHIIPGLGTVPVSKLTPERIDQWLLSLPKKGLSNSTSNNILSVLREIMDFAVKSGMAKANPCDKVERLGNDSVRHSSFTREEVRAVIGKESEWENPLIRLMCATAAMTGMRIGEVRALMADQIEGNTIRVNASLAQKDGRKCTKNRQERVVPIPEFLREALMKIAPVKGGLIFSFDTVHAISVNDVNTALKERCRKLGIDDHTFHSFRVFVNTELVASNINETVVRALVGHQDAKMTEHYMHLETAELDKVKKIQSSILE